MQPIHKIELKGNEGKEKNMKIRIYIAPIGSEAYMVKQQLNVEGVEKK